MKRILFGLACFTLSLFIIWYGGLNMFARNEVNAVWLVVSLFVGIIAASCPGKFLD